MDVLKIKIDPVMRIIIFSCSLAKYTIVKDARYYQIQSIIFLSMHLLHRMNVMIDFI